MYAVATTQSFTTFGVINELEYHNLHGIQMGIDAVTSVGTRFVSTCKARYKFSARATFELGAAGVAEQILINLGISVASTATYAEFVAAYEAYRPIGAVSIVTLVSDGLVEFEVGEFIEIGALVIATLASFTVSHASLFLEPY